MKELNDIDVISRMQDSPVYFLEIAFGLIPQPVKKEFEFAVTLGRLLTHEDWQKWIETVRPDWFEPFEKGKHITWQQWLVLLCIEKAMHGDASKKISIVSGRGVGKSNILALIIIWFLFCFPESIVPCTAVTADQLNEALWKELAVWLERMKPGMRAKFDLSSDHLRIKESPETWFARARTASKDRPEALSGVHAEWICAIVDEASAVHEKVFEMGQGILTSENALMIFISNGTTSEGYFYRSHHDTRAAYQCLSINSEQSPIVNRKYVQSIIDEYCKNIPADQYHTVTEYRVNVLGLFPKMGVMDDKGYLPLLTNRDIRYHHGDADFIGQRIMGVDCAGDGDDKSVWVIRDRLKAVVIHEEQLSTPTSIAAKTISLAEMYKIPLENYRDIVVDAFGTGHSVSQEIAIMTQGKGRVTPVNTGDRCEFEPDRELYINQRAEAYWKMRQWLQHDGIIGVHSALETDLLNLKYRHSGPKIQIEPKLDMKKRGVKSPDYADALSMTFLRMMFSTSSFMTMEEEKHQRQLAAQFDPHDPLGD